MTILNNKTLPDLGPFVYFIAVDKDATPPSWREDSVRMRKALEEALFAFPGDLHDIYASAMSSYSILKLWEDEVYERPMEIYRLTADILDWARQLSKTPESRLWQYMDQFESSGLYPRPESACMELKRDMISTLLHLADTLNRLPARGQVLHVRGF